MAKWLYVKYSSHRQPTTIYSVSWPFFVVLLTAYLAMASHTVYGENELHILNYPRLATFYKTVT